MHQRRSATERCGRAVARPNAQKDFFDADSHTEAPEKEEFLERKENIAYADPERVAKKEVLAVTKRRIAHAVTERVAQEEKIVADPDAERFTTQQEKVFTDS